MPPATTPVSFVGGVIAIATSLTHTADTLRYSFHLDAATTIYVDTLNHYPACRCHRSKQHGQRLLAAD